jgi:hypothetical protein
VYAHARDVAKSRNVSSIKAKISERSYESCAMNAANDINIPFVEAAVHIGSEVFLP